ncbi:MAG: hypothetical protein U9R36_00575 [Elusimicrobiota bacterium]|nr:hypothetical protein [Elusimicrobiota bacterium]
MNILKKTKNSAIFSAVLLDTLVYATRYTKAGSLYTGGSLSTSRDGRQRTAW